MDSPAKLTSKTAAAVVLKDNQDNKAVITWITAVRKRKYTRKRLFFCGSVLFDKKAAAHIQSVILPLIDNTFRSLGITRKAGAYEISIVNPAAASVMDRGMEISGFSADAAVFLALLSAELQIPLKTDFVVTGHIASARGDIRAVHSLSAKITAAKNTDGIKRFILPDVDADLSRKSWHQQELEGQVSEIPAARRQIDIIPAGHICSVIQAVFCERDLLLGALNNGYFDILQGNRGQGRSPDPVTAVLAGDPDRRFWSVLGSDAVAGDLENVRKLLRQRFIYQIKKKEYPPGFGRKLLQKILAVPASIRRTRLSGLLVELELYFQLCRFAGKEDIGLDSRYLRDALESRAGNWYTRESAGIADSESERPQGFDLEDIFSQISEEHLSRKISRPIDQAQADYILERITVDSAEQFFERITSFYIHLINNTSLAPAQINMQMMESSAMQLLQRAFSSRGGCDAALQEALKGYNGGMGMIFNAMAEQMKFEQKTGYINSVLSRVVDQSDFDERIEFTKKLMDYLRKWLPDEIRNRPASTLVDRYQEIIKAYVISIDRLRETFRRF
jgi:hypothetical protein